MARCVPATSLPSCHPPSPPPLGADPVAHTRQAFKGTLFRLPLRTPAQAETSQISKVCLSRIFVRSPMLSARVTNTSPRPFSHFTLQIVYDDKGVWDLFTLLRPEVDEMLLFLKK
jgi:hypothetical protein